MYSIYWLFGDNNKNNNTRICCWKWCKFFFVVANNRDIILCSEIKKSAHTKRKRHIKIDQDKLVYLLLSLVVVMIRTSIFCIDKDTYTRSKKIKTNFATKRIEWCSKVLKKLVISAYKSQWSVHIKIFYVNYMAVERWFIWRFDCYFYMFSFCSLFFGPLKYKKMGVWQRCPEK